jgi:putative transposase
MLSFCAHTIRAALDVELVEFNGEADHVHLLGGYPPALAISTLVHRLKGRTAYAVRHAFTGHCVRAHMRGHLCSPSHFAVSCRSAPLPLIKHAHSEGRATPGDKHDQLTPD